MIMKQPQTELSADLRQLIRLWRDKAHLTQSEAGARTAGRISVRYWRGIECGYLPSVPTATIARMAAALQIPADRLRAVGAADAAASLEQMRRLAGQNRDDGARTQRTLLSADETEIEPYAEQVWADIMTAVADHRRDDLPGSKIFCDADEARQWDMTDIFPTRQERVLLIAYIRMLRAARAGHQSNAC